ncbi:MAG: chemotaxis protein CheB [Comamonas sp.]
MTPPAPATSTAPQAAVPHGPQRFDAVVIGGSAGSVDVLLQLMPALRPGLSATVLIIVHQPPERTSLLASILARRCALPVAEAQDKQIPLPGHLYVAPPSYHLLVDQGPTLALSVDEPVHFSRPSIDVLFESAADVYRQRVLAVLLSGSSADGARGLAGVLACGGQAIVQDPASASMAFMPQAALDLNLGTHTMTPDQLAHFLSTLP